MGTPIADQGELREYRDEAARLTKELRDRIPLWVPAVSLEFTTATYGILGKCSSYAEQLFKNILLLLTCRMETTEAEPPLSSRVAKLTLGEVVRLIKTQQKDSMVFQQTDKMAVGAIFSLLDKIVLLRNRLIHVKIGGASRQAETDLKALLKCVDQFCNSWLLDKLLGDL